MCLYGACRVNHNRSSLGRLPYRRSLSMTIGVLITKQCLLSYQGSYLTKEYPPGPCLFNLLFPSAKICERKQPGLYTDHISDFYHLPCPLSTGEQSNRNLKDSSGLEWTTSLRFSQGLILSTGCGLRVEWNLCFPSPCVNSTWRKRETRDCDQFTAVCYKSFCVNYKDKEGRVYACTVFSRENIILLSSFGVMSRTLIDEPSYGEKTAFRLLETLLLPALLVWRKTTCLSPKTPALLACTY